MVYAGIDWSDRSFQICFIDQEAKVLEEFLIKKTNRGFYELLKRASCYHEIEFAIETYRSPLVDFLLSQGYQVYWLNPNRLSSFRGRYKTSRVKDDRFDAYVLAQVLRSDKNSLPLIKPLPKKVERLKLLWNDLEVLLKEQTRLKNRLSSVLKEYYPAFLNCFEDPFSSAALAFLEKYPNPQEAQELSLSDLTAFFKTLHVYSDSYVLKVHENLHSSFQVRPILVEVRSYLAQAIAQQLLQIGRLIKDYEKRLEKTSQEVEELRALEGIKGIGLKSRIGILIYFYHREWKDFREAQAAAGMSPATYQSGKYHFVHFRKGCIKWARDLFTELAYSTLLYQPWARLYYDRKRKEGKKHYHALRCVGNIWIKILFKLWKEGKTFKHEKHYIAMIESLISRLAA